MPVSFCNSKPKFFWLSGALAGLLVFLYCLRLWQPERQVSLHQRHFLNAVEDRKWKKLDRFLAAGFKDRFGHDKPWVLKESGEIRRHFFALTIVDSDTECRFGPADPKLAVVRTRLRVEGNGTPVAEYVKDAVNSAPEPFVFSWKQQSWKPWDWQLVAADHPLLGRADAEF